MTPNMSDDAFAELKKGSAETLILALLEDGPRRFSEIRDAMGITS